MPVPSLLDEVAMALEVVVVVWAGGGVLPVEWGCPNHVFGGKWCCGGGLSAAAAATAAWLMG